VRSIEVDFVDSKNCRTIRICIQAEIGQNFVLSPFIDLLGKMIGYQTLIFCLNYIVGRVIPSYSIFLFLSKQSQRSRLIEMIYQ
jgi:hypothetical protein